MNRLEIDNTPKYRKDIRCPICRGDARSLVQEHFEIHQCENEHVAIVADAEMGMRGSTSPIFRTGYFKCPVCQDKNTVALSQHDGNFRIIYCGRGHISMWPIYELTTGGFTE